MKILEPGEIKILAKSGAETQETFFTDKNIIWGAIVVVMLILGYMSVKLIRESATVKPKTDGKFLEELSPLRIIEIKSNFHEYYCD